MHCDTPYECFLKNQPFYENSLAVSGKQGKVFECWKQIFAVWIAEGTPKPYELYRKIIDSFKARLENAPECLTPFFSVEGGELIEDDLDRLHILKNDGISLLTLTWNGENRIAGGCNSEKGLTKFGKSVISEINRLKMGCDLSHLNKKSFYSAVALSDFPLVTHSACESVFRHPRNLNDSQLRILKEKNAIIGLCFYPPFLGNDVFEKIYENIFHLCDMGLESNIGIGSDFDGGKMSAGLEKISQIPNLCRFLSKKGLKKDLLHKLFFENADNYIAKLTQKG